MNNFASGLYTILEWVMKFAYLNLLWIVFTLLGGIILGFYPATLAAYSLMRDWLKKNPDLPVFRPFWKTYKANFLKGNLLGIFINLLLVLGAVNIFFIDSFEGDVSLLQIPLFAYLLVVILFLFYLFPVTAHYELRLTGIMKNAFLIMLISPLHSFLIIISFASLYFVFINLPALFFIFGISIACFITTWISLHRFEQIDAKRTV